MADAFSRRMQVLIDGRSVYTPGFGEVPWTSLPLSIDDIERIEVVRGPNSAAYGSNAFFGVINIITQTAAEASGVYVSVQDGQQDMRGASLRFGGGGDALRYRLTLSGQKRDRFASQPEKTRNPPDGSSRRLSAFQYRRHHGQPCVQSRRLARGLMQRSVGTGARSAGGRRSRAIALPPCGGSRHRLVHPVLPHPQQAAGPHY